MTTDKQRTLSEYLLVLLFTFFIVGPLMALYSGWAFSVVYNWLIPPLLNLPEINIFTSTAILYLMNFVIFKKKDLEAYGSKDEQYGAALGVVLHPLVFISIGWILKILLV